MKAKIIPIVFFSISILLLISCEDTTYKEYKGNAPVYMTYSDLRDAVEIKQDVPLSDPGKIYFKDNFIFVVEELKGIHVFDNSDPSAPFKKAFINVPGAVDMAISGNILYTDSYVDLVAIDVQDIENINEVGRVTNVLPYTVPPVDNDYPQASVDKDKGVVLEWELKTIKERVYNNPVYYPYYETDGIRALASSNYKTSYSGGGVSGNGVGIGGSMARFGIKNDVLYLLDGNNIALYDITEKSDPGKLFEFYAGWGIETMFLTEKNMFLGTTTGMIIYDITNPLSLTRISSFSHIRSCDPVVVDDTLAYVTLRSGTTCGGLVNRLDVINIKNLSSPVIVSSFAMKNPHGLGKSGNLLFICDGDAGLKIYDAQNPWLISANLVFSYPSINAYDVIPIDNVLVMIGDDGLYQYDYSNIQNITLLSTIAIEAEE
ncbi:MAG: hypothetical protein A2V64_10070 [Bacteroidetes bacterium RBG_13_43_22]|nr:MAG: hypothetical protein A2V64_10070 [Bacteroidetes bacterium RBG_13_43_22]